MAARSVWKGFIRLSLVSVPVKAFTGTSSGDGEVRLNQLHVDCHSRIRYQKVCPTHGEVKQDAIVSGYEYAKDQYVVVDPEELDKLRPESEKAIQIDTFVPPETVDPAYFAGKTYYLVPDGPVAFKPYALLVQGMKDENTCAVARVVMHNRDQLVLLRPVGKLLSMAMLNFENQVVKPAAYEAEVPDQELSDEEKKLVATLIEASTKKSLDLTKYKDTYTEKLTKLIEAKVQGKEIVSAPPEEAAQVINLMDALRQSVAKVHREEKPPKRMAPSAAKKPAAQKKKKSS